MGRLIRGMQELIKGKGAAGIAVIILLGLGILFLIPFTLVFALRLMGVPIEYTFSSWIGSFIILSLINSGSGGSSEGSDSEEF